MHSLFDDRRYLIPFRASLLPQIFTDVLVIGSGVAGMRAALAAAEHGEVILATKAEIERSNTSWAQGGMAAVIAAEDSFEQHIEDTLRAGAGLCDEPAVRRVVEGGPAAVDELLGWGMRLDFRDGPTRPASPGEADRLALGQEGGHTHRRIIHADGDATGKSLSGCMRAAVQANEHVRVFEQCFVIDLITADTAVGARGNGSPAPAVAAASGPGPIDTALNHGSQVLGAITHHPKYGLQVIWAAATVLTSGGAGQLFRESTNPPVATADGLAMAYRAGAELRDMAFMQFHPTTLYVAGASRALITEAVRGEGATLVDRSGHRFMPDYDDRAELAPRDVVARSIMQHLAATGTSHVFLDARPLACRDASADEPAGRFGQRFPGILRLLNSFDLDPATQLIPVHPSAHYMIGGLWVDAEGRTTLPGLYAAGEAACSGLNGANRLASNSLLEGLVLGKAAGHAAAELIADHPPQRVKIVSDIRLSDRSELDLHDVKSSLRSVMWRHVGIEREGERLAEVGEMFEFWARYTMDKIFDEREGWETQNLLTIGALVTRAAAWRAESRGVHTRLDHLDPDPAFELHDRWQRGREHPLTSPVDRGPLNSGATGRGRTGGVPTQPDSDASTASRSTLKTM